MAGWSAIRALLLVFPMVLGAVAACGEETAPKDDDGAQDGDGDGDADGGAGGASSTTSTGSGNGPATVADACEGMGNYYAVCYDDPSFDVAGCSGTDACFALVYRDDAEQPMLDCFAGWANAPTCGQWCSDQIAPSLTPAPEHAAHEASCAAYESDCGMSAGDVCNNPVVQLEPGLVAIIDNCIDGECAALETCLDAAVGDYLAACGGNTGGLW